MGINRLRVTHGEWLDDDGPDVLDDGVGHKQMLGENSLVQNNTTATMPTLNPPKGIKGQSVHHAAFELARWQSPSARADANDSLDRVT